MGYKRECTQQGRGVIVSFLVLRRRLNETDERLRAVVIFLPDGRRVRVIIGDVCGRKDHPVVKLLFEAPPDILILREELTREAPVTGDSVDERRCLIVDAQSAQTIGDLDRTVLLLDAMLKSAYNRGVKDTLRKVSPHTQLCRSLTAGAEGRLDGPPEAYTEGLAKARAECPSCCAAAMLIGERNNE